MEPFRISASQLTLYQMCPRKYRYQYVEGRERTEIPAALAFGSAIHAAIEWAEKLRSRSTGVNPKDAIRIFEGDLKAQAEGEPPLVFKNGDSLEHLLSIGEALLPLALTALAKTEPLAIEEPFEVIVPSEELEDGTAIHLVGIFDRLETDGTIVEIKTAGKRYSPIEVAQHLQSSVYVLAQGLRERRGENGDSGAASLPPVRLLLLLKTARPDIAWIETRRTPDEILWVARLIGETARAIDRGIFPPRLSWACPECEFRTLCDAERAKRTTALPRHAVVSAMNGGAGHNAAREFVTPRAS